MNQEKPLTREELRKMRPSLRHIYIAQNESQKASKKIAIWVTEKVGTMGFFYMLLIWTIVWCGWNTFAPNTFRFDPFPAFVLWIFISNVMQLTFLPLIMVGQNLQGEHENARDQADFELNQIAEKEIDTVLIHLENQNDMMIEMLAKLETLIKEDIALDKKAVEEKK